MKIKIEVEIEVEDYVNLLEEECVDNLEELATIYKSQAKKDPADFITSWSYLLNIKSLEIT